jgi:hypothetical protein
VPAFIELSSEITNTFFLATGLMLAGVLKDDDWNGQLTSSLNAGVERWLNELGVERLRHFQLSFGYTDNVENSSMVNDWMTHVNDQSKGPAGMFALEHDPYDVLPHISAGNRVLDLEHLCPGAGFNLIRMVYKALNNTVNTMTPWEALGHCENQYEMLLDTFDVNEEEDREPPRDKDGSVAQWYVEERTGRQSPEGLKKSLPKQLFNYKKPSRAPLKRALRSIGAWSQDDEDARLLQTALRLFDVLDKTEKKFEDSPPAALYLESNPVFATVVHWASYDEQDAITRACDEYLEDLSQMQDYATDIVWFASFYTQDAASIIRAVERVKSCVEILLLLDEILLLLHSDEPLRKPEAKPHKVPKGKTLLQQLEQEELLTDEGEVVTTV